VRANRWVALLAGLWAGLLLGVGLIGAPAGFAVALPEMAGRAAGRMFVQEAYVSLALGVLLLVLTRRRARSDAAASAGSLFSADMLMVLGALFCTVAGHFAIQPMMAAARAGQGSLSFGALHAVSVGFYGVKTLLVVALAWRQTAR